MTEDFSWEMYPCPVPEYVLDKWWQSPAVKMLRRDRNRALKHIEGLLEAMKPDFEQDAVERGIHQAIRVKAARRFLKAATEEQGKACEQ